jgi:hypothetical protein
MTRFYSYKDEDFSDPDYCLEVVLAQVEALPLEAALRVLEEAAEMVQFAITARAQLQTDVTR